MSRAKFEEWCKSRKIETDSLIGAAYYELWLAGRESMRDEAAAKCANESVCYDTDHEWNVRCAAAEEIKAIEP